MMNIISRVFGVWICLIFLLIDACFSQYSTNSYLSHYKPKYLKKIVEKIPFHTKKLLPPLAISNIFPSPNELNVFRNEAIRITFMSNITATSVNANTLIIRSEQLGDIDGDYIVTGNEIRFEPNQNFLAGDVIHVTITAGIQDTGGNVLPRSFQYEFRIKTETNGSPNVSFSRLDIESFFDNPIDIAVADMDNDGDLDIIGAFYTGRTIVWFENSTGAGNAYNPRTVANSTDIPAGFRPYRITTGDLDRDGDMDLVAILENPGGDDQIIWYVNDGSQTFTPQVLNTEMLVAKSIRIDDIDGDTDLDVLLADFGRDDTWWLVNDGAQNFTPIRYLNFAGTINAYSGDVNKDGDIDLLVMQGVAGAGSVNWYQNDGSNDFTNQNIRVPTLGSTTGGAEGYLIDMDRDQDMDILATFNDNNLIAWFENDGDAGTPSFIQREIDRGISDVKNFYPADLDGDGDLDIVTMSNNTGEVLWLENNGIQDFTKRNILNSNPESGLFKVYAADMDNDGDLDIISQNANGNKIFVNLNLSIRFTGSSPVANATSVTLNSNITLNFNNQIAISATSVNSSNITVRGSQTGLVDGTYNITGAGNSTTIIFNPSQDFKAGEIITVDIGRGLGSSTGINLDKSYHFEFSTISSPGPVIPNEFLEHVVSTNASFAEFVYAADVDSDGDLDILSASVT